MNFGAFFGECSGRPVHHKFSNIFTTKSSVFFTGSGTPGHPRVPVFGGPRPSHILAYSCSSSLSFSSPTQANLLLSTTAQTKQPTWPQVFLYKKKTSGSLTPVIPYFWSTARKRRARHPLITPAHRTVISNSTRKLAL